MSSSLPGTPLRSCVGCRRCVPAAELVRFVLVKHTLQVDRSGTAAGRGAWLHPDRECADLARRRGGFARSFRQQVDDTVLTGLFG